MVWRIWYEDQVCLAWQGCGQRVKGKIGPDVAVDDQERVITQQGQRLFNTSAGLQGAVAFGRIADLYTEGAAVAKGRFNPIAETGMIDHQFGKARPGQRFHVMLQQRFAGHRQQGFGTVIGQGAHSPASPRRQYHCPHLPFSTQIRYRRWHCISCIKPMEGRAEDDVINCGHFFNHW